MTNSTMTARERVFRALEFNRPDRVPRDLWMVPRAAMVYGQDAIDAFCRRWPGDFVQAMVGRRPPLRAKGSPVEVGQYTDEWGCVFETVVAGIHGQVKDPLVSDWSKLDEVRPPEELLEVDGGAVRDFCRNTDRFVLGSGWARPFERLQFLRGTENVLMDLGERSGELRQLLGLIHDFFRRQFEIWAGTAVDALVIMDDWGSQQSLLISPRLWREWFKPLYAEYASIAHAGGKKLFMHSDGYILDIYEDLIEVGVDAVNSQLFCMDLAAIGARCAGRIAFWGEIDRQQVLPHGTVADVRAAVARVVEHLWRPEGGVIAQFELSADTPLENAHAVYESWERLTAAAPLSLNP
ncbi:MAG: uroporphyrinogen decarboxylase family protein [Thermoguttaceae bacterium]|jgi:hypothetical protein